MSVHDKMTHDEAVGHLEHEATKPDQIHAAVTQHATPEIHDAAAAHKNTPTKTIQHIYDHPQVHESVEAHNELKQHLAAHQNAPHKIVKEQLDTITPDNYDHQIHNDIVMHSKTDPADRAAKVKEIMARKVSPEDMDSDDEGLPKGVQPLSYGQKELMRGYLKHPDTDAKTVSSFIKHKHPQVAAYAAASPHASEEDHEAFFKRKDIKPEHFKDVIGKQYSGRGNDLDIDPGFLARGYEHFKNAPKVKGKGSFHDRDTNEDAINSIIEHKDAPESVLNDVIGKKAHKKKEDISSYNQSPRVDAFEHPNTSKDTVQDFVQKGDVHAMQAAVKRGDTDEQTLRTIDSHGHESLNHAMLSHPNYPKDLTMKRMHDSADNARKILSRKELDPEILNEALKHKNQNVAVEALNHPSITKEHVLQAYNRKAKEVSEAAAAHDLAPDDVKMAKASTSPEAAIKIANNTEDPELLGKLHDLHGKDPNVLKALAKNKNTSPEVINKMIDHQMKEPGRNQFGSSLHHDLTLYSHPNLDAKGRGKFLKENPSAVSNHPNLTGEEIGGALKDWSDRSGKGAREHLESFAKGVFDHPNLKPEDAKDLVLGKYGKIGDSRGWGSNDLAAIHKHPDVFTPEVVKAGVNAPHELASGAMVHELAQSKHLDASDLDKIVRAPVPNDDQARAHHIERSTGALVNPNVGEDVLKDVLSGVNPDMSTESNVEAALKNPKITDKHLQDAIKNPTLHLGIDAAQEAANQIQKRDLKPEALRTTIHPDLVAHLLGGGRYADNEGTLAALENPHPQVIKTALNHFAKAHSPGRDSHGKMVRPKVDAGLHAEFDKLADHPDKEVVAKAFPFMSPDKQKQVVQTMGADDPEIMRGLGDETIRNLKVTPDMSADATRALLEHHAATPEHFKQAIDHSEEGAIHAVNSFDDPDKNQRKESFQARFPHEDMEDILSHAFKKHPGSARVGQQVAKYTRDPGLLRQMLNNPETAWGTHNAISENPQLKSSDVESSLTKLHGPEHSGVMEAFADSPKATVPVLQHIAEHYPEHMSEVAKSPRAASAKVLKTLIDKGDVQTKVNLVENPKVPEGIKDELLTDKNVLFQARPDSVNPKELEKYAKDKDLSIANAAVNHKHATSEVAKKAVDHAFKNLQADPENAQKILESASKKSFLEPDTQAKLLMYSPKTAAKVIYYSGDGGGPFNKEAAKDALNKFEGKPGYHEMLRALINHSALKDPQIAHKIIDTIDLNHVDGDKSGSADLNQLFSRRADIAALTPEHYNKTLDKMKQARPADFKYPNDEVGNTQREGDAKLMNTLLSDAPDKTLNDYVKIPAFASVVAQNPKVGRQNLDTAISHLTDSKDAPKLQQEEWRNIVDQANITPAHLDKIYNHLSKDPTENTHALEAVAKSSALSPELASKMYKELPRTAGLHGDLAQNKNLPDEDLKDYTSKGIDELVHGAKNPKFRLDMASPELMKTPADRAKVHVNVAENQYADPKDLEKIYADDQVPHAEIIKKNLIRNVRTSEKLANQMLESGKIRKEDMYENPAIGGKLWREQKHEFPKVNGLEPGKEINEAVFRPREDKVKKVASMIPPGGSLDWAQFKKENPSLSGDPIIQQMFSKAPKQRLDTKSAEEFVKSMPAKKFHVSYDKWTGIQRHNDEPQAVFVLNNGESMDHQYKDNPNLTGLYRTVQLANQNQGHPHGPQAIGWSRVDTSNKDHWFVDEIQSDFNSSLSRELDEINKTGKTSGMEQFGLKPDEGNKAVRDMTDMTMGWERALLQNIIDTAKKHGAKKVSIHSGQTKTNMNKGRKAEVTNKYDKLYNRLTQDMGFKASKYDDIPSAGDSKDLKGQQVWTLDLSEPQEAIQAKPAALKESQSQPEGSAQARVK